MVTKKEQRLLIRQRLTAHKPAEDVATKLGACSAFREAQVVLLYSALPTEVSLQSVIDRLVGEGKTVLLPRVVSRTDMELRRYTNAESLIPGAFGIFEPTGELFTDYDTIDVAIVPGLAFDRESHRLGHGRGYYDRLLPKLRNAYKIGLCYTSQLLDHVVTDEHDIAMDSVLAIEG